MNLGDPLLGPPLQALVVRYVCIHVSHERGCEGFLDRLTDLPTALSALDRPTVCPPSKPTARGVSTRLSVPQTLANRSRAPPRSPLRRPGSRAPPQTTAARAGHQMPSG